MTNFNLYLIPRLFQRGLYKRLRSIEYMLDNGWLPLAYAALNDAFRVHGQHPLLIALAQKLEEYDA